MYVSSVKPKVHMLSRTEIATLISGQCLVGRGFQELAEACSDQKNGNDDHGQGA